MILVLVLSVFAAGSVVHVTGATTMAVDMAMVEMMETASEAMNSADCDACVVEDGSGSTACELVCSTVGFAAVPTSDAPESKPTLRDLRQRFSDVRLTGVGDLPLQNPPRPIL